ncbi:hypothetical protein [Halopseudomonas aestusnigri]|uniref:Uncharacterized protein n=1 Tax=Halopseudomonas aestusnigri TaxID=857252 RepID=A0AAQ1G8L7_9GAMM|nr:hypothetical protein [Halopseudomonas aestusnigri]OWL86390.1 hypothetical protein B7O88_13675 [Halopseudomonas aestusnigri]SEG56793.1 hypothetical protein SAMN05216586_11014 [Halopseudomonas aestusnigri]
MLVFADTAWHVISAFFIFFAGVFVAFAQRRIFQVSNGRAISLYLWHSFFCIFYIWYSLDNVADSRLYYLNSLEYEFDFSFGTSGIYFITALLSQGLGFSYGNAFLVFNIFGYIGLLAFASGVQEVTRNSSRYIRNFSVFFLYLPGLSFWSSAIGKDALTFMAAGLVTWAALDPGRRFPAIGLGAVLFLIPRPHMAGIFLIALCLALLVSSQMGAIKKLLLLLAAIPLSVAGVQFGLSYAGLGDATGVADITNYFEERQGYNLEGGSSVDIAGMSPPMRLFTYLFRPLFFDANSLLSFAVSLENLLLLLLFLVVAFRLKRTRSNLNRFAFAFYIFFVLGAWFVLANTTANLGIAIRQKTMFLPMLIVLLFSIWRGGSNHSRNSESVH